MQWQKPKDKYGVVVIGGGPAGLMAAYHAASRGFQTAIIEKMNVPARKLRITGKGRCNIVNNTDTDGFLSNIRAGARFLYSSFSAFDSQAIMQFFEEHGVALKTERGNRVFPESEHADDVANALIDAAAAAGCDFVNARVSELLIGTDAVCGVKLANQATIKADAVVVATGGLSYPKTGSTGDGFRFAKQAGHTVTDIAPSLVPLTCAGNRCVQLQGLSLRNVKLTARESNRIVFSQQGEMLFTHFGVSGPLVLSLSAAIVGRDAALLSVAVDLKPALDSEMLDKRILRDFADNSNRAYKNSLGALLPQKIIPVIVAASNIDPEKKVHAVTVQERERLVNTIKSLSVTITGTRPIDEAVITAGGVLLKEIDPKTMMSKKVKNLHFAGEVLDADGFTGGFNLGIAFATGAAAGRHCLEEKA